MRAIGMKVREAEEDEHALLIKTVCGGSYHEQAMHYPSKEDLPDVVWLFNIIRSLNSTEYARVLMAIDEGAK